MICPNCKEEIADGRRICPKCGMPTASSTVRPVPEAEDNAKDIGKKIHSLEPAVKAEAERKEKERQEKKEKAEKEKEEALRKFEEDFKSKLEDLGLESVGDDFSGLEDLCGFDDESLPDFLFDCDDEEEEDFIPEEDDSSFEEVEVLSDDSDEAPKDALTLSECCDYYNGRQVILEGSFLALAEDGLNYRLSIGDSGCGMLCLIPCSVSAIDKGILEGLKEDQKVSVKGTFNLDSSRTPYIEVSEMEGDAFFLKVG